MKGKVLILGSVLLAASSFAIAENKLPCYQDTVPVDTGVYCHNTPGFTLGCYLTHSEVVQLRELVDKNFQKKSSVTLTQADESNIWIDVQWNGVVTKWIVNRSDFTYSPYEENKS